MDALVRNLVENAVCEQKYCMMMMSICRHAVYDELNTIDRAKIVYARMNDDDSKTFDAMKDADVDQNLYAYAMNERVLIVRCSSKMSMQIMKSDARTSR